MQTNRHRVSPGRIASYAVLGVWSLICLFPIYWLAIASIKSPADLSGPPRYVPFVDFPPSLSSWRFILSDPAESLMRAFLNSLVISGLASGICVLAAGLFIYGLTRYPRRRPLPGHRLMLPVMLALRAIPPVVLALPIYGLAGMVGLLDSLRLMISIYAAINLPVALWLLAPVVGYKPSEEEEAAQLDGASHVRVFGDVLLPMVRMQLAVTGLLIFLLCWNEYLFAAYLAADHVQTLSPWMTGQLSMKEAQAAAEGEEAGRLAAAAILMAVPAMVLAALIQRRLARSLPGTR